MKYVIIAKFIAARDYIVFFANFENQRRNIQEQDLQALEDKTVSLSLVQGV